MPFVPDRDAYDRLTDELACIDPWDREYQRPSQFPSPHAFVQAMTVAAAQTPAPTAPVTAAPSSTALTGATPSTTPR